MTVSSEVSTAGPFFGNGSVKTFPYAFKILDEKHIRVVFISTLGDVSDLSLANGDYTVTGVGNEAGGNVVKATPLLTGQTLTIVRRLPLTQDTSLENQGAYYPEVVEQRFDLLTMQIQSVQETTERSLTVEPGQEKPTMALIAAAGGFAQGAKQSRDESGEFAEDAADSATASAQSATLSGRWASAPEDQEVVPTMGLFSAFHWYRKTLSIWNSVIAGWSSAVHGAPLKASPSLADEFGFADSGDSWKIKKQTFAKLQEVFGVPIGTAIMMPGNGNSPPPGFLLMNGAPCTSAYPQLRAWLLANGATVDGNGDPIIEDMGGYFPRGWRSGQVVDSGRAFGSAQQDQFQNHRHPANRVTNATVSAVVNNNQQGPVFYIVDGNYVNTPQTYANGHGATLPGGDGGTPPRTGEETRPVNKTFTYWIKAYSSDQVPGSADFAALANNVQSQGVRISALEAKFISAPQTATLGGLVSAAHGLGSAPSRYSAYLRCIVSEGNWAVGDETPAYYVPVSGGGYGIQVYRDATTISGRIGSAGLASIGNKTTGVPFTASVGSWQVILRAIL
ncbi:hypothetical protein [Agrobacterium cavarae]|uniref:hypothetical protein n=1 Tax=Agrobacterium cavarae TaxID=2528239 RepID=UPI002FFB669F